MRAIPMLMLVAALAGCAGTNFNYDNARRVKVGMSQAEVLQIMNKPYSVTQNGSNEIWVWSRANGFTGSTRAISFILSGGFVVGVPDIPYNIGDSKKQMAVARIAPATPATSSVEAAPISPAAAPGTLLSEKAYKEEQVRLLMQKGLPYDQYQRQYKLIMGQ